MAAVHVAVALPADPARGGISGIGRISRISECASRTGDGARACRGAPRLRETEGGCCE